MKNIALTIMLLFSITFISKADDDKTSVKSDITKVTVFLNGAQVTRTASATLPVGQSNLVFEGLSQYVNASSIQVKGTGDFVILSVSHQLDYLSSQTKTKEVTTLEDTLESYNTQLSLQQSVLEILVSEKTMILANQSIGGTTTGVKVEDVKILAEYIRTRLTDIAAKYLAANARIKKLQANISKVTSQLATLNAKNNIPTSDITVAVSSKIRVAATFEITYAVTGAYWSPSYDLRALNVDSPISLNYRANVLQTTGEDWKNVTLTLSTGNPSQSGSKPILNPWYLYVYTPYNYNYNNRTNAPMSVTEVTKTKEEDKDDQNGEKNVVYDALNASSYTTVDVNATTFKFEISIPYTINSDGKNNIVDIQTYTLPATYQYYCAPKLDPSAFLLAKVTGWEDYNLLSGYINLYFEGTYIGKSYLNVKDTKDTLDFSLGRDESIVVERKKQKDFNTTKIVGTTRKVAIAWEISVRNKKKTPVTIVIEDQLPLSSDKLIEIERGETTDASYNETTGSLLWTLKLNSAETKKLKFDYTVKFPKDKNVYIQ
jgi:uncharacterized protein (TIGR02231 family)